MSHSSAHPCTWCEVHQSCLKLRGNSRTIGNIKKNYEAWCKAGLVTKKAKDFYNCNNNPIFSGNDDKKIIEFITPPELHLMIGVVNTIIDKMEEEFNLETTAWIKKLCIHREVIHANAGFNGNSCKVILDDVETLRNSRNIGILRNMLMYSINLIKL